MHGPRQIQIQIFPVLFLLIQIKMPVPSTRFLEDGSYLRLKNIMLGYNVPAQLIAIYDKRSCKQFPDLCFGSKHADIYKL